MRKTTIGFFFALITAFLSLGQFASACCMPISRPVVIIVVPRKPVLICIPARTFQIFQQTPCLCGLGLGAPGNNTLPGGFAITGVTVTTLNLTPLPYTFAPDPAVTANLAAGAPLPGAQWFGFSGVSQPNGPPEDAFIFFNTNVDSSNAALLSGLQVQTAAGHSDGAGNPVLPNFAYANNGPISIAAPSHVPEPNSLVIGLIGAFTTLGLVRRKTSKRA